MWDDFQIKSFMKLKGEPSQFPLNLDLSVIERISNILTPKHVYF